MSLTFRGTYKNLGTFDASGAHPAVAGTVAITPLGGSATNATLVAGAYSATLPSFSGKVTVVQTIAGLAAPITTVYFVVDGTTTDTSQDVFIPEAAGGIPSGTYVDTTTAQTVAGVKAFAAEPQFPVASVLQARTLREAQRHSNAFVPSLVTILAGQEDEAAPGTSNATASRDLTNFKVGIQGWRLATSGAVSALGWWDPLQAAPGPDPTVITQPPQAIGMWVYVDDVSKLSGSITLSLFSKADLSTAWSASKAASALVNGWNLVRWSAVAGVLTLAEWGVIYQLRVGFTTTAAAFITLGHIWAECAPKAQILLVQDSGHDTAFYSQGAYAALKARNIPVTWALDPGLHGTGTPGDPADRMTDAEVLAALAENGNAPSFHAWNATVTSGMTAAEIRADTMRCQKWLESKGYRAPWRAAWLQNSAPQAAAAQSLLMAYATPSSTAGADCWPPSDQWNIPRYAMHGRTNGEIDDLFTQLQTTHQFICMYLHGVHAIGSAQGMMTLAEWAYWLAKVDAALAAGWLEFVTFEQLAARSGIKHRQGLGDWATEYYSLDGVQQMKRLP